MIFKLSSASPYSLSGMLFLGDKIEGFESLITEVCKFHVSLGVAVFNIEQLVEGI